MVKNSPSAYGVAAIMVLYVFRSQIWYGWLCLFQRCQNNGTMGQEETFFRDKPHFRQHFHCESTIVLDMATSVVARGKFILASHDGKSIPEGWAMDKNGYSTTNASKAMDDCVLPVGAPKRVPVLL